VPNALNIRIARGMDCITGMATGKMYWSATIQKYFLQPAPDFTIMNN